jgi:hypothetical protein
VRKRLLLPLDNTAGSLMIVMMLYKPSY